MRNNHFRDNFRVTALASIFSLIGLSFSCLASFAQTAIAPDKTLPVNTVVNFNNKTYTITGGTQVGTNQFHSFQDFSVPTGNTAHFANELTTTNLIGRVTGSNISNIDGTLRTNGSANLYLINPNGIIFGANAKLDIAGSFSASTANSIKFSDGSEFSAINPQAPPLLQVSIPLGLQYGKSNVGATITNSGNLTAGQDLVLSADKLDLQGSLQSGRDLTLSAHDSVKIRDTVTVPFFGVAGRNLLIQGDKSVDIFTLNNVNSGFWSAGNMLLRSDNPAIGDAHFYSGGNLKIEKLDGSIGNLISPHDPVVLANGDVSIGNYTGASLHILAGGSVTLGNVTINSTGAVSTTINPSNKALFNNSTKTYADLANVELTEYTLNNNAAGVTNLTDKKTSVTIDGNKLPTLDVRAGIDWTQLGGLPSSPIISSTDSSVSIIPANPISPINSNIETGTIDITRSGGVVLLTNQYVPKNNLTGTISTGEITTSSTDGNVGNIRLYSQGNIAVGGNIITGLNESSHSGEIRLDSAQGGITVNGGVISGATTGTAGGITIHARDDIKIGERHPYYSSINASTNVKSSQGSRSGDTGDIIVISDNKSISVKVGIFTNSATSVGDAGKSGNIWLQAGDKITAGYKDSLCTSECSLFGITTISAVESGAKGKASVSGSITIQAKNDITVTSNRVDNGRRGTGGVSTESIGYNGSANTGGIQIKSAEGNIFLGTGAITSSTTTEGNAGSSGNINIEGKNISVGEKLGTSDANATGIRTTSNSGLGQSSNSGDITLKAIQDLVFGNSISKDNPVNINSESKGMTGAGKAGDITLKVGKNLVFPSQVTSESNGAGNGGNIILTSLIPILLQKREITSSVSGSGAGGLIQINAPAITLDATTLKSTTSTTEKRTDESAYSFGRGGDIQLSIKGSGLLELKNGTILNSSTNGTGDAGNIELSASSISFSQGSQVLAKTSGQGNAGDISIIAANAGSLSIADGAQISTSTAGNGYAGFILITATNGAVSLSGTNSGIFSTVDSEAMSNGFGYISIDAESLSIANGAKVSTSTSGKGNTGDIYITVRGKVQVSGVNSGIFSTVETKGISNEIGTVTIKARSLSVTDSAQISTSTAGQGNAGNILITAETLNIQNGGSVSTSTATNGNSGNINIILGEALFLDGNGSLITAGTTEASKGKGGNILIDPPLVSITNGAVISVNSLGKGNGGSLNIVADKFIFANKAALFANTASGEGGNINLKITDIFFPRNNSNITATAGGTGNGGNISLSSLFMVAVPSENSDLFANAFFGKGGQIDINTQGLFGLGFRPRLTPLSDITASSEFGVQGTVSINTPGVDPSNGLSNLPTDTSDASKLVSQKCLADRQSSSFVITGRGGVPASPFGTISANNIPDRLGSISNQSASNTSNLVTSTSANPSDRPSDRIVEAQGWVINTKGQISLIAAARPAQVWLNQPKCK